MTTYTRQPFATLFAVALMSFISINISAQVGNYFAGTSAGLGNTASNVTGVGYFSLSSSNSGTANSGFGSYALWKNTTGNSNTAIGSKTLSSNTTGYRNTAVGTSALLTNISGIQNTAIGFEALALNTGNSNTAVGMQSLRNNTTGAFNNAFGSFALLSNTTGTSNNAFGYSALRTNTTGSYNTAVGREALYANTTGSYNNAMGYFALRTNTTGAKNTAIGQEALYSNTTGYSNIAIGSFAMRSNTSGTRNYAIGESALYRNTTGTLNIAVGEDALYYNSTGTANIGIGYWALKENAIGGSNVAVGERAMNFGGESSTALGYQAIANGFADSCEALGKRSMSAFGSFKGSIAIGANSLADADPMRIYNVVNSIFIGKNTSINNPLPAGNITMNNSIAIGYNVSIDADNKVVIGNNAITSIGGQVGWTTISDKRLKTNINKSKLGLDFILSLNPVTYNYKAEGQKNVLYTGLIAQEVDEAASKAGVAYSAVDKNGEMWGIRYAELTVPLIKAMQEVNEKMKTENEELKARIEKLEQTVASMQKGTLNSTSLSSAVLFQNQPNPFNQQTNILYKLSSTDKEASIVIRNMNGSVVKQMKVAAGSNKITVNANELSSGTYTYTLLVNGNIADTKLMVITK